MRSDPLFENKINLYLHNEFPDELMPIIKQILPNVEFLTLSFTEMINNGYVDKVNRIANGKFSNGISPICLKKKKNYDQFFSMINEYDHAPIKKHVFMVYIPLKSEVEKQDFLDVKPDDWKRELMVGFQEVKAYYECVIKHLSLEHHDIQFITFVEKLCDQNNENCCAAIIHSLIRKTNDMINTIYGIDNIKCTPLFYDRERLRLNQILKLINS